MISAILHDLRCYHHLQHLVPLVEQLHHWHCFHEEQAPQFLHLKMQAQGAIYPLLPSSFLDSSEKGWFQLLRSKGKIGFNDFQCIFT